MDTRLQRAVLSTALALAVLPALAQGDQRAQLVQLQQQVQKLRQDNAQLNTQLQQARAAAGEADKLKAESDKVRQEATRLRGSAAAGQQQARRLQDELEARGAELARVQAEAEQLRAELARRNEALAQASAALAKQRADADNERAVLGARLKLASTRVEQCEAQHAKAVTLGEDLVRVVEADRTRACEPFTGLWRVREEQRVQQWRDRLHDVRVPAAAPDSAAAAASAPAARP